ncbi:hypothetical protein [Solitalea canadensis]|nr:hypothetical protein [Solitalea canadensis]
MKKFMALVALAAFTTGAFAQTTPAKKADTKKETKEVKATAKATDAKKEVKATSKPAPAKKSDAKTAKPKA